VRVVALALLVVAACSSGSSTPGGADAAGGLDLGGGDAGHGDAAHDATTGTDAPAADGGALACGSMTCTGDDLCVTVSTCGGAVQCTDLPDGGSCPTGTTQMVCPTGRPGCVAGCPPPTSSCRPRPAACGATISCTCITSTTCGGPSCASASGRSVFCANS